MSPSRHCRRILAGSAALAAVVAGSVVYLHYAGRAREAATELQALQSPLEQRRTEMLTAIKTRAREQQALFVSGPLASPPAEAAELRKMAAEIANLSFASPEDFGRADALQTRVSDAIARKLNQGEIGRELARAIERADMDVHRKRMAYFELVRQERSLRRTPLLQHGGIPLPPPAPVFPAEAMLLGQRH
jgi:hypothetical protein